MRRISIFLFCVLFLTIPVFAQGFGGTVGQGAGSGLDADKLDGQHGSYYLTASSGAQIDDNLSEITQIKIDTATNRTDIDDNKTVLEELSSSTLELYYTNEVTPSGEYLLLTSTVPTGSESTIVSAMDSATVVVATFTVETVLGLSALRAGLYHSHFHAEMSNTNRDVRLRFEVWNGTGPAETFLFSSEQSNLMTASKAAYDIHVSTIEITANVDYLVIRIVADVTGVAAAPDLTFYMEGANSSLFEMPALLSEVGVTKVIAGTNIEVSPTNGKGDVSVAVSDPPTHGTMNIGSFVYHDGDTNTYWVFSTDNLKLVAGGLNGLELNEGTVDIIYHGDGAWDYQIWGDTTNAMAEISSYTYLGQLWQLRNLDVAFGGRFSTITILGAAEAATLNTGNGDNELFAMNQDVEDTDTVKFLEEELTDGTTIGGKASAGEFSGDGQYLTNLSTEPCVASGGNKTREEKIMAESFSTAGLTNNASIALEEFEVTYDGATSTAAAYFIKCPNSADPNYAYTSMNWSQEWDDGTVDVDIYVNFKTSSTSDGTVWTEVGISSCQFVGDSFEVYRTTTDIGSGWCDQSTATFTITSTSVLFDGRDITVHLGRNFGDSSTQTVYYKSCNFTYTVD
jgi:hypothetical protein